MTGQAIPGVLLALITACATYHAAPIDPAAEPARLAARSAGDPGLLAFRAASGYPATDSAAWRPTDFAIAAIYFRATLDEARADIRVAEAAEVAAGARPRPGVAGSVERNAERSDESSPWGVQLTPTFIVELGGKRGARIAIAKAHTLAVTARLRVAAWQIANAARTSAYHTATLEHNASFLAGARRLADSIATLVEQRYDEGGIGRSEVSRAQADRDQVTLEAVQAEREWQSSLASTQGLAGLRVGSMPATSVALTGAAECGTSGSGISADSLRGLALATRWEVAEAAAQYQEAEGGLRLMVAQQRPDLELGPGLFFDHGITRFLVNFVLPFIPGGNRGQIAEAEARRRAAAAHLTTVQETILAEVDQAVAACTSGATAVREALALTQAADDHANSVSAALNRGELGRLEQVQAAMQAYRARLGLAQLESQLIEDRAELEQSAGVWFSEAGSSWPDVLRQPDRGNPMGSR